MTFFGILFVFNTAQKKSRLTRAPIAVAAMLLGGAKIKGLVQAERTESPFRLKLAGNENAKMSLWWQRAFCSFSVRSPIVHSKGIVISDSANQVPVIVCSIMRVFFPSETMKYETSKQVHGVCLLPYFFPRTKYWLGPTWTNTNLDKLLCRCKLQVSMFSRVKRSSVLCLSPFVKLHGHVFRTLSFKMDTTLSHGKILIAGNIRQAETAFLRGYRPGDHLLLSDIPEISAGCGWKMDPGNPSVLIQFAFHPCWTQSWREIWTSAIISNQHREPRFLQKYRGRRRWRLHAVATRTLWGDRDCQQENGKESGKSLRSSGSHRMLS